MPRIERVGRERVEGGPRVVGDEVLEDRAITRGGGDVRGQEGVYVLLDCSDAASTEDGVQAVESGDGLLHADARHEVCVRGLVAGREVVSS